MSIVYKCKRCGKNETDHFPNIKKHLNKKYACNKKKDVIFYSDDQLLVCSLIPYYNNIQSINMDDIEHLKHSNIVDRNKKELFNELENIEKNKLKDCPYCNKNFNLISDLKKHILLNCFHNKYKDIENKKEHIILEQVITDQINNDVNGTNNSLYNKCNLTTNNNNNNNININFEVNNVVPFDKDWDVSKIDKSNKNSIICSNLMYTTLLEELLKNKNNLNVIIDKEKDSGMVYKNDVDEYIQMKSSDIASKTMEKLNIQLNKMNKDAKEESFIFPSIVDYSRQMINKKYNDYVKTDTIQDNVQKFICDIYNSKKQESLEMAEIVIKNNKKINKVGF